jgi:hypothetical protein
MSFFICIIYCNFKHNLEERQFRRKGERSLIAIHPSTSTCKLIIHQVMYSTRSLNKEILQCSNIRANIPVSSSTKTWSKRYKWNNCWKWVDENIQFYHDVLLSLHKQTSDLSIGYNLISTCAGSCDWLSRRKCTCWWIIVWLGITY